MSIHLEPLRYGQQFRLCERGVGISPYLRADDPYYYNLRHPDGVKEVTPERLMTVVDTTASLIAHNVHWGIDLGRGFAGGWWVGAFRISDGKRFGFFQRIDDAQWRRQFPDDSVGQRDEVVISVTRVGWPDPSPQSLMWAVVALADERMPGSSRALLSVDVIWGLTELPLEEGLPHALRLLKECCVPDPETALHERGFQV